MKRVLGLGLVLVLLATACGGGTSVTELDAGDCFDDPDSEVVSSLELIDCAEPHDNEVFSQIFMPESTFPGDTAIGDFAFDGCLAPFEAYVGESYEDSPLDYFYLGPTEDSWDLGDRGVLCVLYSADLSKLTGSSRG
ncbi:MAG: hypothetical protein GY926_03910 [bacterium]|nr:hypothetical protein [bacterium]